MIGIVDYGMGNLLSVFHAFESLGADVQICTDAEQLHDCERIVLPGVGAMGDCMARLNTTGFAEALHATVRDGGRPFLGICLGMQATAGRSYEGGETSTLGWFDADVVRLTPEPDTLRVPHVGWNDVATVPEAACFQQLPAAPDFYFVHSYHMQCRDLRDVIATCDYGGPVTAAVCRDNILATQFHPEKSQQYGLQLLENFLAWSPA